jgi:methionyl-tRNA formyltransferase
MRLRLAFMGTPDFAAPTFLALLAAGHEVACVYTRAPRPAGRGQRERPSPIHALAAERGLAVRTPRTLKDAVEQAAFATLGLDAAVVVAYGLILPQAVLDAPRLGCLNLHASLLPRWRGAAPIARAIMAGDAETGVMAMQMEAGLDTGPILAERRVAIGADETAGELHDRLAALGAPLTVEALDGLASGRLEARPQDEAGATYAPKLDKAEARIDWRRGAAELHRLVRGLSPFPGAWFEAGGARVKALRASLVEGAGEPGAVLDDRFTVACGEGALRLTELQREGRGSLPAEAFLRGFPLGPGQRLG